MEKKYSIIMFSMSPYSEWANEKKANRNFHVLQELLKDARIDKILTVDFLPHTIKRSVKNFLRLLSTRPPGTVVERTTTSICSRVSEKLYVYSTVDPLLSQDRMHARINRLARVLGLTPALLWSFTPLYTRYITEVTAEKRVFDAVDDWSEHPAYAKIKSVLKDNYRILASSADTIFTVTEHIANTLFSGNSKAVCVPNGVDTTFFSTPQPIPVDLATLPGKRIGYIGVLQSRIDFNLIAEAARMFPEASFPLIGPVWPDADTRPVRGIPNVYFLGKKHYDELPGYAQHIDVGIIPHISSALVHSMNPLKMFEYLAAGKPVVTTPVSGTEMFATYVTVARTPKEFTDGLHVALTQGGPQAAAQRMAAVAPHSWKTRVSTMLDTVLNTN